MKVVMAPAWYWCMQTTTCVGERKVMEAWLVGGCGLGALMRMPALLAM